MPMQIPLRSLFTRALPALLLVGCQDSETSCYECVVPAYADIGDMLGPTDGPVPDRAQDDGALWCKTGTSAAFVDGDFSGGWTDEVVPGRSKGTDNSYAVSRESTGGNPDAYRRIDLTIGLGQVALWVLNMKKDAMWDPATQGGICGIRARMDGTDKDAGTTETIYSMALRQEGKIYWSEDFRVNVEGWKTMDPADETAFIQWDPFGLTGPDLSASGKPIQFGFLAGASGNNTTGNPRTFKYGVDNWRFVVCPCS